MAACSSAHLFPSPSLLRDFGFLLIQWEDEVLQACLLHGSKCHPSMAKEGNTMMWVLLIHTDVTVYMWCVLDF